MIGHNRCPHGESPTGWSALPTSFGWYALTCCSCIDMVCAYRSMTSACPALHHRRHSLAWTKASFCRRTEDLYFFHAVSNEDPAIPFQTFLQTRSCKAGARGFLHGTVAMLRWLARTFLSRHKKECWKKRTHTQVNWLFWSVPLLLVQSVKSPINHLNFIDCDKQATKKSK